LTLDGRKVYVANIGDNTLPAIDTATDMVVAVLPVGDAPIAFGVFIQPRFAGTMELPTVMTTVLRRRPRRLAASNRRR
jgi:YVTN family beta-propeller protein